MKNFIAALACLLLLSACGAEEQEQPFSLTAEEQKACAEQIDAVMEEFYWSYDRDSLSFGPGVVPEISAASERFFSASADCDYFLKNRAGEQGILAEAELLHYNGDHAGTLECYFFGDKLTGVLYRGGYDNAYYSLRERNPFLADGEFRSYEKWEGMAQDFRESSGTFSPEGILSSGKDGNGNTLAVCIENGRVMVYRFANSTLSRYRNFTYNRSLEATSAAFLNGEDARLAVLISSIEETGQGESERSFTRSEKIMLYDENLYAAGEIPLESELCTAIGAEDNRIYLFNDQSMEVYELLDGLWQRTERIRLRHFVTQFHVTDLDGDGTKEYLMTDGMDLYLYHRVDSGFRLLWSTHLGVENFYGPLASGDLNRDGVKEVYACDVTGTTIRYLLTEKGLRASNEDIAYGECFYPLDFNGDGLEDYWFVEDNINRRGRLYLAEGR